MDEFLGNIAVIDQLSTAGQNLISAATTQLGMAQNEVVSMESGSVTEAEAELRAFEDRETRALRKAHLRHLPRSIRTQPRQQLAPRSSPSS